MTRRRTLGAIAATAALTMALAACSSSDGGTSKNGSGDASKPAFNGAVGKVVNPSKVKGGVLRMANTADWDSLDPGNTYYAYSWNFIRLYSRALTVMQGGSVGAPRPSIVVPMDAAVARKGAAAAHKGMLSAPRGELAAPSGSAPLLSRKPAGPNR
jgi:peptide/nickel transport system substrate-binding protein